MGENSKIEWTDHTWNPWVGCTKVSSACDFCYAELWAKSTGHPELWAGERRRTKTWGEPFKWDKRARELGLRQRVFCASLADVFDNQVPLEWRREMFSVIWNTLNLDWLLLTKRPQNIAKMLPDNWADGYPNVWLGVTAENQEEYARRWNILARIPAIIRFISYEPALEPLGNLRARPSGRFPDWIIMGGESGARARVMDPQWAADMRDTCELAGIPFFFKQMTGKAPIPDELMVRQFPKARGRKEG